MHTDGFFALLRWVTRQYMSVMSGAAFKVYCALGDHIDERFRTCFPSRDTLKEITGLGLSTISQALKELEELGLIKSDMESGRVTLYTLAASAPQAAGFALTWKQRRNTQKGTHTPPDLPLLAEPVSNKSNPSKDGENYKHSTDAPRDRPETPARDDVDKLLGPTEPGTHNPSRNWSSVGQNLEYTPPDSGGEQETRTTTTEKNQVLGLFDADRLPEDPWIIAETALKCLGMAMPRITQLLGQHEPEDIIQMVRNALARRVQLDEKGEEMENICGWISEGLNKCKLPVKPSRAAIKRQGHVDRMMVLMCAERQ